MKAGEFPEGARVLRAKIDMASGNINLRDPTLYRILHAPHPRTGARWKIYPTYDFAHGQSDAIEHVTHSICTMEFEDHRPLYDWLVEHLPTPSRPRQYEFARLNLGHTVLSKRRLIRLVEDGHVAGWDDPRMPTLAGLRRRGVPAAGVREFIRRIGVAKADNLVEAAQFDAAIRDVLNETAPRRMAVLKPLKLTIENWPEGKVDWLPAANHPADPDRGIRVIPFGRELWIERDDFMEDPPKKFSAWRRAGRSVCASPGSRPAPTWRATRTAPSRNCAAPSIRIRAAAPRRTGARCGAPSTGCRRPMPSRPRCACTTGCSAPRSPAAPAVTGLTTSTRTR